MQDDVAGEQMLYRDGGRVFSTARLKMGRGNSGKLVSEVKLALFREAKDAEIAILDGSPGIGCPVISSVSGVDLVLIVAEPSLSGIHDMERILNTARTLGAKTAVCVNKFDAAPEQAQAIEDFCRDSGVAFVGRIPYDPAARKAVNEGYSLARVDCPAREALKEVFSRTMERLNA